VAESANDAGPEVGVAAGESARRITGKSPWLLAARRLRRNRIALAGLVLFLLIVAITFAAPLYARHVAQTDPFASNISGSTVVNGERVDVLQPGGGALGIGVRPIGPTWHSNFFIGADNQGRDVMARVLYGGRASLTIGIGAAVLCCVTALLLALVAGFFGGSIDVGLSRLMDLIWAFPVFLLAISLATVLLTQPDGLQWGPIHVDPSSLWVPTIIIALVYVPYVYRPVRGRVLAVREEEYIAAALAQGASNLRLMFSEILPNVMPTVIVMLPLMIATTLLTEAALSFLSIGVQPPKASWGTVIDDGRALLYSRPMVAIAPGIMVVLTVLSLNVLGDGIRDALDPRAKLRVRIRGAP
jgi:peptide/nickel transport system permease protein